MRLMYDSVTPSAIPPDAAMVAGYVNGPYQWAAEDWFAFPHAVLVEISVRANYPGGHVLDVEPGDATPAQAPDWVQMRRMSGLLMPAVYCNLSTWPTVRNEFFRRRIPEPLYWIAHYDGKFEIPSGAVAKQYLPNYLGTDHSAVADFWPGVDGEIHPPAGNEADMLERMTISPKDDGQGVTRVRLSGTSVAGIIVRPAELDKDGYNHSHPVYVGNIYAWGSDRQGIGHNPTQLPTYDDRVVAPRRFELPGAVWADVNWSSHLPFTLECY
jgi:hypothetical protein